MNPGINGPVSARPTTDRSAFYFCLCFLLFLAVAFAFWRENRTAEPALYYPLIPATSFTSWPNMATNFKLMFRGYANGYARTLTGYLAFEGLALFFLAVGYAILRRLFKLEYPTGEAPLHGFEVLALSYLLGSLAASLIWLALGSAGILKSEAAWALWAAGPVLAAVQVRAQGLRRAGSFLVSQWREWSGLDKALALAVLALVAVLSTFAVHPQSHVDILFSQMGLPNFYIREGRLLGYPHHIYSYIAQNTEMLVVWALLLKSEVAAVLLVWGFLAAFVALMYGYLRRHTSPTAAWAGTVLLLSAPVLIHQSIKLKNDMGPTVFLFAHYCALAEALSCRQSGRPWARSWFLLSALLCAGAVGHKQMNLAAAAISACVVIWSDRRQGDGNRFLWPWLAALALAAGPWFLRSLILTGDPLYPLIHRILDLETIRPWHGAETYTSFRNLAVVKEGWSVAAGYIRGIFLTLQRESLWGPSAVFAFLSLVYSRRRRADGYGACALAAFLSWLALTVYVNAHRFHMGFMAFLICVPFAFYWQHVLDGHPGRALRWAVSSILLGYFAYVYHCAYLWKLTRWSLARTVSGFSQGNYAMQRTELDNWFWMCRLINTHSPKEDRFLLFEVPSAYGLDRRILFNFGHDKPLIYNIVESCRDGAELRDRLQSMGIQHVIANYDRAEMYWPLADKYRESLKIQEMFDRYMDLVVASPDDRTFWYAFKEPGKRHHIQLGPKDAEEFPLMMVDAAWAEYRRGNPAVAKAMCNAVLQAHTHEEVELYAFNALAGLSSSEGDKGNAEKFLMAGIRNHPERAMAYYNLAGFYNSQGDPKSGFLLCQRALELDPGLAAAHHYLGLLYSQHGELEKAEAFFRRVLQINPVYYAAYNDLGTVYFQRQDYQRALELYQVSLRIYSDYANAHENLGAAYFHLGRYDDAVKEFEWVVRHEPGNANAQAKLNQALEIRSRMPGSPKPPER